MRRTLLVVAALAGAACMPPAVTVTPAGPGLRLAPRPPDCAIEFHRTRPPDRPYDEIAALHLRFNRDDPAAAQEALRAEACALGADGVVVTREYALGFMAGTAVSYRGMREKHRLDAALRKAEGERREAEQAAAARAGRERAAAADPRSVPPAGFVPARARQPVLAYALPDRSGTPIGDFAVGATVWVGPKGSSGWRRIWVPGRQDAWVEGDAVELVGAPAVPPPPASAPPAPEPKPSVKPTDV